MKGGVSGAVLSIMLILLGVAIAGNIDILSGGINRAGLYTEVTTQKWGGFTGVIKPGTMSETTDPIFIYSAVAGTVDEINISASNLDDNRHYIAALVEYGGIDSTYSINVSKIANVTRDDLNSTGLFRQAVFPVFHPNYDMLSDNPNATFCCENESVMISGVWYNAFKITLNNNVPLYLLKYRYSSTDSLPLFVVPLSSSYTCYTGSSCGYEFILPDGETYNVYILPKEPAYDTKIWVDSVETTQVPNTGIPYNITVYVYNKYTLAPAPDKDVIIFEQEGNNIFSPFKPASSEFDVGTIGTTDSNGMVQFIISPTVTQTEESVYHLKVGLYWGEDYISNVKNLTVVDTALVGGKKSFSPSSILDNSKAAVVAMIQIEDSVYKWALDGKANSYIVYAYTDGTYQIFNQTDLSYYSRGVLNTGGVNKLTVVLKDTSGSEVPGYVNPKEEGGYLIMNPTYDPPVIGYKDHLNIVRNITTGASNAFVVVPSRYSVANSNFTLEVYKADGTKVVDIPFDIDKDTAVPSNAFSYQNDEMKSKITKTIQVINTLYYAYK